MRRVVAVVALLCLAGFGWWWLRAEPTVSEPSRKLDYDEPVEMRWVEEETGEEDVWTVTKREADRADLAPPPLPEPDPAAGTGRPDESARTLHAMGLESWKRGEIREAMEQFAQAIEIDPDDPLPRTQYGRLLVLGMAYTDALPQLERAAELNPDDPQVWLDLTTYYEKTRTLTRAWEARRKAEALAGDRPIVQDPVSGFYVVEGNSIYP